MKNACAWAITLNWLLDPTPAFPAVSTQLPALNVTVTLPGAKSPVKRYRNVFVVPIRVTPPVTATVVPIPAPESVISFPSMVVMSTCAPEVGVSVTSM